MQSHNEELCVCVNPFCDEEQHAPYVPTPITDEAPEGLDWEGPLQPEYSEF